VLGHNIETVSRLYPTVRPGADYGRSLDVLRRGQRRGLITKTAIMVGLGEAADEVLATIRDARRAGCDILYIGQYLRPTPDHLAVVRYVEPSEFDRYRQDASAMGFAVVVAGPLVRSSYHTREQADFVQRSRSAGRRTLE
jgi:lipoic acid synthetase